MTKDDVKSGRRFHHKEDHRSQEYAFRKKFGRHLFLKKGTLRDVGEVTSINEESFTLSTWVLGQEISVKIPYTECIIIEPNK